MKIFKYIKDGIKDVLEKIKQEKTENKRISFYIDAINKTESKHGCNITENVFYKECRKSGNYNTKKELEPDFCKREVLRDIDEILNSEEFVKFSEFSKNNPRAAIHVGNPDKEIFLKL